MMPDVRVPRLSLVPVALPPAEDAYTEVFAQQSVSAYYAAPDDGDPHYIPAAA